MTPADLVRQLNELLEYAFDLNSTERQSKKDDAHNIRNVISQRLNVVVSEMELEIKKGV